MCGQTPAQAGQRGCGICTLGDTQNSTGRGPEQPALVDLALSTLD